MTLMEQIVTISMCVLGTMLTRFLPFLIFPDNKETPKYIQYLGTVLPGALFGLLVVYCLRNVSLFDGNHAVPEILAIGLTVILHKWKKNMLVSIAFGTIFYMFLVQTVF